jgi:hypothetical protein
MEPAMSPSVITDPQIAKLNGNLRAMLEKYRQEFPADASQAAIENLGCMKEILSVFRKYVDATSNPIVRIVNVTDCTAKEALEATGRVQCVDSRVVAAMPKGDVGETELVFFNVGREVSDDDLEQEYALRGLVPTPPFALFKAHQDDPAMADEHPNATHWKEADGKWSCAICDRWRGERYVRVDRRDVGWGARCWFAGSRKKVLGTSDTVA